MPLEEVPTNTKRKYQKPTFNRIMPAEIVLDLIERAKRDERLTVILKSSIHQWDPDYQED